jgi:hypothetical protein
LQDGSSALTQLPFILRVSQYYGRFNVFDAKANLADHFREKKHIRDPGHIDKLLSFGYMTMHNAEHKYSDVYHWEKFIRPAVP